MPRALFKAKNREKKKKKKGSIFITSNSREIIYTMSNALPAVEEPHIRPKGNRAKEIQQRTRRGANGHGEEARKAELEGEVIVYER